MRLVYRNSSPGHVCKIGDRVETSRGEVGKLLKIEEPRHAGSTGRVYVQIDGFTHSLLPSVIAAKWVEREDQAAYPTAGRRDHEH